MTSWYVDLILLAVTLALLWKLRAGPLRGIMPYVWRCAGRRVDRLLSDLAGGDAPGRGSVGFPAVAGDAGHCLDDCRSLSRGRAADAPMVLATRGRKGFSLAGRRPRLPANVAVASAAGPAAWARPWNRACRWTRRWRPRVPGSRPAQFVAVRAGCETGQLASRWRRDRGRRRRRYQARLAGSQLAYLFVLVSFAFATITFIQIKLVPEFIKIFDGFGLHCPR